ncbi:MAG: IS1 family transposase [Candidatus Moraniibacteriota bacterium]|nr:MAG: IS1 family transposase [Candidatus Moranbacteria bacterium]
MAFCSKKKSKLWIWLAVDRETMAIVDFAVGSRGASTGKKLWKKIRHLDCSLHTSDYWEAYRKFLPQDKHITSKAETFSVEGMNNLLRHFIARFKRRTHCYSKSVVMVLKTLLLFQYREMVVSILS